jgi:PhnB protein
VNPAAERGPGNLPYARVGHASLTPYLAVDNAHAAHDFYVAAFGAMRLQGLEDAQGCIVHGPLRIGNALVVVNDAMPDVGLLPPRLGGMSTLLLFCPDADALYEQAVRAGARAVIPVTPMFSGDRHGLLVCPFGHRWIIATQMEHLSDETILSRWAELQSASHPSPAADPGPSNLPPNQEPAS